MSRLEEGTDPPPPPSPDITGIKLNDGKNLYITTRDNSKYDSSRYSGVQINFVEVNGVSLNKKIKDFTVCLNNLKIPTVIIDIARRSPLAVQIWFLAFGPPTTPGNGGAEPPDKTKSDSSGIKGVGAITVTIDTEDEPVSGTGEI